MAARLQVQSNSSDGVLVRRFVRQQDGEAFSMLMSRYADMVYTTCWRILGNESLAADAVQETFFQLVKDADRITGSLGGWLHRVATRRAVDLVRKDVSRRDREMTYALEADGPANSWSELEPAVDEALEELPEDLREVLLLHFLQGHSTVRIAAEQGVSQPTISRRLAEGLELLREKLRNRDIAAGAIPLQAILLHSNHLAPEAVKMGLGKMALAKAAGAWSLGDFVHISVGLKWTIAASTVALVAVALWMKRPEVTNHRAVSALTAQPVPQAAASVPENPQPETKTLEASVISDSGNLGEVAPTSLPAPLPVVSRTAQTIRTPAANSALPTAMQPVEPSNPVTPVPTVPVAVNQPGSTGAGAWPSAGLGYDTLVNRNVYLNGRLYRPAVNGLDNQSSKTNQTLEQGVGRGRAGPNSGNYVAPLRAPSGGPRPPAGGPPRRVVVNGL